MELRFTRQQASRDEHARAAHGGDFGGKCLIGECTFDADLLLPTTIYHGLQKSGSLMFGSWRDGAGNLCRAIRGVLADSAPLGHLFAAAPGSQLEHVKHAEDRMWSGPIAVQRAGDSVSFRSIGARTAENFEFTHEADACRWVEGDALDVSGRAIGPAVQWFNTWAGGACMTVTAKYRSIGTLLGRPVQGFIGHEIHYFSPHANWIESPYGQGREFCWQHVANEYDDAASSRRASPMAQTAGDLPWCTTTQALSTRQPT